MKLVREYSSSKVFFDFLGDRLHKMTTVFDLFRKIFWSRDTFFCFNQLIWTSPIIFINEIFLPKPSFSTKIGFFYYLFSRYVCGWIWRVFVLRKLINVPSKQLHQTEVKSLSLVLRFKNVVCRCSWYQTSIKYHFFKLVNRYKNKIFFLRWW